MPYFSSAFFSNSLKKSCRNAMKFKQFEPARPRSSVVLRSDPNCLQWLSNRAFLNLCCSPWPKFYFPKYF